MSASEVLAATDLPQLATRLYSAPSTIHLCCRVFCALAPFFGPHMLRNTSSQLAVLSRRLPSAPTHLRAATSDASSSVASGSKPRPSPKPAHLSLADLKVKHGMPRRQNGKQRATNPTPPGKRLLKPYDLSLRLQKMCNEGDIDKAVETLKNMPLDAQNTPTWNTMVQRAGQAGRLQLAYSLYLDVRFSATSTVSYTQSFRFLCTYSPVCRVPACYAGPVKGR